MKEEDDVKHKKKRTKKIQISHSLLMIILCNVRFFSTFIVIVVGGAVARDVCKMKRKKVGKSV